jgi:drug/metabolite transporter (DMT)-like permease
MICSGETLADHDRGLLMPDFRHQKPTIMKRPGQRSGLVWWGRLAMLAVLLALASAIGFGASDYTAGLATRATSVLRVTLSSQGTSLALSLLIVPWLSPLRLTAGGFWWGMIAGLAGTGGAITLYLGFRHAAFSVASTLSAVGSAALSVLAGLLFGERPGALALTGIALALPAIAAVSASPGEPGGAVGSVDGEAPAGGEAGSAGGRPLAGVGLGIVAGVCFALYFVGLNRAGTASGLWPVVVGEVVAVPLVAVIAAASGQLGLPAAGTRWQAAATGVCGGAATMLFFVASHDGLLAVTAVIVALYPAGTIVLARVLLGERLSRMRVAGLCLAAASVALIAAAGQ